MQIVFILHFLDYFFQGPCFGLFSINLPAHEGKKTKTIETVKGKSATCRTQIYGI